MKRIATTVLLTMLLLVIALGAFVYSGTYDIGADSPHAAPVAALLETTRERAVARHSDAVAVRLPEGTDALREGGEHYARMCAHCHLAPGMLDTELREGLNPRPPDLSRHGVEDPARAFWVAKHGIKMSGMPAWGRSHDDATLWKIIAFARALPGLSAEEYQRLSEAGVAGGHGHGDETDGHAEGHGEHADGHAQ